LSDPVPDFSISVGGADLSAVFRDRLVSLRITDASGKESDTLELVLDDRDNVIATPGRGVSIVLAIGYRGGDLVPQGTFVVDELEAEGPPDRLTIRAKSADMRASLKSAKTRAWRSTTVGGVVAKVAAEHGLKPAVSPALAAQEVTHQDQTNESDLHFLTRLGRDLDAVAAPKNGHLVFAAAGEGLAASGKRLAAVELRREDLTSWRATVADRAAHGTVRARYHDVAAGKTKFATAGEGAPVKTLKPHHRGHGHAKSAAAAALKQAKRDGSTIEVTLPGRAEIGAQTPLTLSGLREELAGRWIVERVEHAMDFEGGGFTTQIEGVRS
jgi:phage protein D